MLRMSCIMLSHISTLNRTKHKPKTPISSNTQKLWVGMWVHFSFTRLRTKFNMYMQHAVRVNSNMHRQGQCNKFNMQE